MYVSIYLSIYRSMLVTFHPPYDCCIETLSPETKCDRTAYHVHVALIPHNAAQMTCGMNAEYVWRP